jgi:uncharacterized membrane protein YgaE (UPF0421/DUF939 family)
MAKLINLLPTNLKEAKNVDVSDLVKRIEKHTDRNAHTESVLELAKFLKEKKMENILNSIMDIHKEMGSMPSELSKLRGQILDELLKFVKTKYGYDIYTQINSAF